MINYHTAASRTTIVATHQIPTHRAQAARHHAAMRRVAKACQAQYHHAQGRGWFAVEHLGEPFTSRFRAEIVTAAASEGVAL